MTLSEAAVSPLLSRIDDSTDLPYHGLMADYVHQHRVPRLLLRGWESSAFGQERQLAVTSLLTRRTRRQTSKKVTVGDYIYGLFSGPDQVIPDIRIEHQLGDIENESRVILENWRAGGDITPADILPMSRLLSAQSLRTPATEIMMRLTAEDNNAVLPDKLLTTQAAGYIEHHVDDYAAAFNERYDWYLVDFSEFLVTTDRPISYYPELISTAENAQAIFMPVGRYLGLFLHKKIGAHSATQRVAAKRGHRQAALGSTLRHAGNLIIHHLDDHLPDRLVPPPMNDKWYHDQHPLLPTAQGKEMMRHFQRAEVWESLHYTEIEWITEED